jgi:hypothetical protein
MTRREITAPYAVRPMEPWAPPATLFDDLEIAGKVKLPLDLRARMEAELTGFVTIMRLQASGLAPVNIRAQIDAVVEAAENLRIAVYQLTTDALVVFDRALATPDSIVPVLIKVEWVVDWVKRGASLAALPRGRKLPSSIWPLVHRLGPLYHEAGGRVSATDNGPFVRFVRTVHDILPDELKHRRHENPDETEPAMMDHRQGRQGNKRGREAGTASDRASLALARSGQTMLQKIFGFA